MATSTPCIISVAITGSLPRKKDNPAVPVTVSEQVESTHAAYEAGATLVHLRPDMASLASGSVNFPTRVYDNAPDLVDWLAGQMQAYGVKPEIEAFDLSMIFQAVALQKCGRIAGTLHIQFVMGIKNAMPVDREVFEFYVKTLHRLAPDATWTGAGIGKDQLTLARWSLELGGHCRTGLEDNVRLDRETLAPSNATLVAQIAGLCEQYGRRVATPREARALLRLAPQPEHRTATQLQAEHAPA